MVYQSVIYNLGGYKCSHSVAWCRLSSTTHFRWKLADLAHHNFKGYYSREAFEVENKIVYFGSRDVNSSFVLEQEEDSEQLRVVRED